MDIRGEVADMHYISSRCIVEQGSPVYLDTRYKRMITGIHIQIAGEMYVSSLDSYLDS